MTCACGCGEPVNPGRRYVNGHSGRGRRAWFIERGVKSPGRGYRRIAESCCNGHRYTPATLFVNKDGTRCCRVCHRERMRRYRERRQA